MSDGFPAEGMELTHILVVADIDRARSFYRDVLGAEVYREYGGTSCVLRAFGTWLLLVTGGGPTADKPTVTFAPPTDPDVVGHAMTIRVPDCRAAFATLRDRGAAFLTDRSSPTGRSAPSSAIRTDTSSRSARRRPAPRLAPDAGRQLMAKTTVTLAPRSWVPGLTGVVAPSAAACGAPAL